MGADIASASLSKTTGSGNLTIRRKLSTMRKMFKLTLNFLLKESQNAKILKASSQQTSCPEPN